MRAAPKSVNPFPGLRAFRQEEDYLFFGREEQTLELLQRLGTNRFVAVVGTSGSGKSSLVRCGLLSELLGGKMRQAGASWEVAVTHPGGNPLALLTDALLEADLYDIEEESARENLLATLSRSHFGLVEAVRQAGIGKGTNFLLVVDQFEELFRFREAGRTQQEAAAEFVSLLLETVAQNDVPIYVVLTMRSDFIGECSQFEGLAEMVNRGEFLIPRLTREQYKRVIEGPVKVAGGQIAPRLLQRLLNDLGQQADQLPCLQHALMRTWDVWSTEGESAAIDLADYQRVGRMAEALSLHADEVYASLANDRDREWCRGIFEALTVKESENRGIRRPQRLSQLSEILEVPAEKLIPVIDAYRRQGVTFLMPAPEVELTEETIIDISHESLMRVWTRLRHWVEEEAQAAGIYRRLAENASLHAQGQAGLYRDPELGIALAWLGRARHANAAWAERYRPGFALAMAFLKTSRDTAEAEEREREAARQRELEQAKALATAERRRLAEQEKSARRLRKLLATAGIIAVIAVGASIFAAQQTRKAKASELAASSLAAELKTNLVHGDWDLSYAKLEDGDGASSLAYLSRAMRNDPDFAPAGMRAVSTLTNGSIPTRRFPVIEHENPISDVFHNEKHDVLVTSSDGGADVRLWDFESGTQRATLSLSKPGEADWLDHSPADATVRARIFEDFAGARGIWLDGDPDNAPPEPRYFRKSIDLPEGRSPVRADLFLEVDDEFDLSLNGIPAGRGTGWSTTFHVGVLADGLADGFDLRITARNHQGFARLVAAVIVTFEAGEPLVVTSDGSWLSSRDPVEGFARSRELPRRDETGKAAVAMNRTGLTNLAWSADRDRILAMGMGTPNRSTDDGPNTMIRFVNRLAEEVSLFWLDREGKRKPYGKIAPGDEQRQGTAVGHVFLVTDREDRPLLVVRATAEQLDAIIDGSTGPIDLDERTVIAAWDVSTGEAAGALLPVAGGMQRFQVAPLDGPDDLVGCEFADGTLQVWNRTTGEAESPPLRTGGTVTRWAFTPDGRRIIGLFSDSRVGVWETVGGAEVARFDTRPTFAEELHLSPDGQHFAVIDGQNRKFAWWEIAPGGVRPPNWITVPFTLVDLRFHSTGDRISAVGTEGNGILRAQTWSLAGRDLLANISSDPNAIQMGLVDRAFSVIGAVNGNLITVWDLASGEIIQRMAAPELLESANLSPDGRRVVAGSATSGTSAVAGSAEKKLYVFDLFAGRLAIPRPIVLAGPSPVTFSPDAETLVTLDRTEGFIRFWDLRTGRQVREPIAANSVQSATFARSGTRVALWQWSSVAYGEQSIGQRTGRLFLEQIGTPPALPEFLAERGSSLGWVHAPSDGRHWMVWSRRPGEDFSQLVTRDRDSLEVVRTIDFEISEGWGYPVWSRDGRRVAFSKEPMAFAIADTTSGKLLVEIRHEANATVATAVSHDGSLAAFGFDDGTVKIWSQEDGERVIDPFPESDSIQTLVLNQDGSLLGVGDRTRATVAVVDSRTGEPRVPPREGETPADDFAFTPDGKSVIVSSAGSSGKLPMFDLQTGERVREFELREWSRALDLSPDGKVLGVGSGGDLSATSGIAYLFEVASGRMLTPPLSAGGTVMELAFDSKGKVVATGTYETPTGFGYAQLWDVATGRALSDPITGRGRVVALTFLPDGSALAVGWSNGVVNRVPVPPRSAIPDWLPELAEAIADRRLAPDTGLLEILGDNRLEALRQRFLAGDRDSESGDPWLPWARWTFEDPRERALSPGAATTMARHLARLRAANDIFDLHQAVRWSPDDALTHARLAILYQEATPANLPESAKPHWDAAAIWFSDRAIALAPDDAEVWTMRAELMRRLSRTGPATEATARVFALAPEGQSSDSPNALYQKAMALGAEGKWDEAGETFGRALGLLDGYRRQLDAGEQPLPLLGVLPSLLPTRKGSGVRTGSREEGRPTQAIAGAFEDFEGTVDGRLPEGWRVWNRTDREDPYQVHHLGRIETDLWQDWVVLGREKLEAIPGELPARVVEEGTKPIIDGEPRSLLDGRFALAISRGRLGKQVQFLESPDFDCTGQAGVQLSFHSAYEAHARGMGIVEYSIDGGTSWLPARYFVHQEFVNEARPSGAADAEIDLEKLLDVRRNDLPWWIDEGKVVGGRYGDFVSGPRDFPGLAACFEGRPPATDANRLDFKRVESIPLPEADGKPAVRVRFGLVASNARYWGIDSVGLHASGETEPAPDSEPKAVAFTRPADEAATLVRLAMETAFGREVAGDPERVSEQIAATVSAATAGTGALSDPVGQTRPSATSSLGENLAEARLLAQQALTREGGRDSAVRGSVAQVLLRCQEADQAWEILTDTDDVAADLARSEWRGALSAIAFLRGALSAAMGNREGAYALLTMADQLLDGSGGLRQAIQETLVLLETPEEAARRPQDVVLVPRGSPWSYFDEGQLPAENWNQPDFDDSRWFRGRAPLGYGDPGIVTSVQSGPDSSNRYPTTYFRSSFERADPPQGGALVLRVRRDDGVIVYLNGVEIARDGLPDGPVGYGTFASITVSDDDETRFFTLPVNAFQLREGTNVLAAEVHQVNATSSDLAFDLELISSVSASERATLAVPIHVLGAQLEKLGVPGAVRSHVLGKLVETLAEKGDLGPLREGLAVVEATYGTAGLGETKETAEMRRLRSLAAAAEGDLAAADGLYREALEGIFARVDAAEAFDCRALPLALREAALLVRRGPPDLAFFYQSVQSQSAPQIEKNLALRWSRRAVGDDPDGLAVLHRGLMEAKRYEEALAIADAVLAAVKEPAAGAPPVEIRKYKGWLQKREAALAGLGRSEDAEAVRQAIFAAPTRDPALSAKLVDLSAFYNCSLYDGRGWGSDDLHLAFLPETFPATKPAVDFDLRGLIQLCDENPEEGRRGFPQRVDGIPIGAETAAIHFLLGAGDAYSTRAQEVEIGRLIFHYMDGTEEALPLVTQVNISDYWYYDDQSLDPSRIAWTGRNTRANARPPFQLIRATWANPHPEKPVATIDFVSAMNQAEPFLVAITLE